MSANSKIEWTDHTWSPWEGCQKVGPGCDHCYAEARNARFGGGQPINWGAGAPRRRTSDSYWKLPIKWNDLAAATGVRQRVFPSLCDPFDNAVDPAWRAELLALIACTPHLDWLLLTKRIGNVAPMIEAPGMQKDGLPSNVWLGATIVNQEEADRDIPKLLRVPAAKRFLSMEPLLGPVDLTRIDINGDFEIYPLSGTADCEDYDGPIPDIPALDWIIVGGESGPGARPMHPDWARSLRDQCEAAGVPFLFKQWGEHIPVDVEATAGDGTLVYALEGCGELPERKHTIVSAHGQDFAKVGKSTAGRLLDGREWNEVPS